ncbi:MAG: hydrogenase iron-sulfur subunit [Deltaproteobacteria bacterium]|nr:hydrogenase iron-sulfur subunit [Deltaproteobacteria bacterium]MBW1927991.1 hydrogenase iron-sulfur subunit [Deltaproteobacteria bacterium]MBW2024152.1 hydrogenase iron-sulfur subunit [Deltaproteobacteria bacterium]MBW2124434.1 hydrogenase iron-sulfur subunit [Deltaproteobacteria bacterium]
MTGREQDITKSILILGNGPYSLKVAHEVAALGYSVTLAVQNTIEFTPTGNQKPVFELLMPAILLDFGGEPGGFRTVFGLGDGRSQVQKPFGCIVIAMECLWHSAIQAWGVTEEGSILNFSQVSSDPTRFTDQLGPEDKVVFLCGFVHNSHPFVQERIVKTAKAIKEQAGSSVYVLTEHFKVAYEGLERIIRQAREAGVIFVKFSSSRPELEARDESILIAYYDEALGAKVHMSANLVIVEEGAYPAEESGEISRVLGVSLDKQGFFQGDFIHNLPIFTNRTGIFVVGSGKGPISDAQADVEAKAVALEIAKLFDGYQKATCQPTISLDKKKCTICLTCYRLCPHRAISYKNRRPEFSSLACRQCGICVAVCPMNAIELGEYNREAILANVKEAAARHGDGGERGLPRFLILACQNSAYDAYILAKKRDLPLQAEVSVVKIPCGGRVELEMVIKAFAYGADCVMVLTCHHDSCKSFDGSMECEQKVKALQEMLKEMGIDEARLVFGTLAPGSAMEFAQLINDVAKRFMKQDPRVNLAV